MAVFDDIKAALDEAIDFEQGKLKARKTVISVAPVATFKPEEIKKIRLNTGLTQAVFAKYMGVSVKTVEAWESGRNHPEGAACRLLSFTQMDPSFPQKSGIVSQ